MTDKEYIYGYPIQCTKCVNVSHHKINLRVAPYYLAGTGARVMLIGQDPTIFKQSSRVVRVLMLDQPTSRLSRWLRGLFGEDIFNTLTLYATNLVKCSFDNPPSVTAKGGLKFLRPYFENCQSYLREELTSFRPNLALTLGEPAHKLFVSILDNGNSVPVSMQQAFTGQFIKAKFNQLEFDYSPCLHIKTFRVAQVYGDSVKRFKTGLSEYFKGVIE